MPLAIPPLVRLRRIVPPDCGNVYVKLEWENPTGSMKDRMALAVISQAETGGRLKPGGTVIEYTGGSTGTSLALVCAAKGYRSQIVTSDAFSQEKRDHMVALGAQLTLVPSEAGQTTRKLILDMIEDCPRTQPQIRHLLDRSAQQLRQHWRLSRAGRRDLEADERRDRRIRSLRRYGGLVTRCRHRTEASQAQYQDHCRRAR